jgi:hypothetical protein
MIWIKRRFNAADYAPYMDRLEKLLMTNATLYREWSARTQMMRL